MERIRLVQHHVLAMCARIVHRLLRKSYSASGNVESLPQPSRSNDIMQMCMPKDPLASILSAKGRWKGMGSQGGNLLRGIFSGA